jgi:hypothetical protein
VCAPLRQIYIYIQATMRLWPAVALAAALCPTNAFVAPPRARLHALAGAVTTDDAIEQKLDSWLLDNLGSCSVVVDDDDDDAFELCSVDSPTEGCVDVHNVLAPEEPRAPPAKTKLCIRRRKEPAIGRVAHL